MPGFDAGSVVEPLDYSFKTLLDPSGKPYCDKAGAVREPTDRQLADYLAGIKKLVASFRGKLPDDLMSGTASPAELTDAVGDLDPEVVIEFHAGLAAVVAKLCSDDPSAEDLLKLPIRIRGLFYSWLQQEVMAPEAAPGGGSAQVTTLRRAAAG
jgi:hypothetical protein